MAIQFSANGDALANATDATFFQPSTSPQSISVWMSAPWDGTVGTRSYVGMYNSAGGTAVQIGTRVTGRCDIWTWGGGILVSSTGITMPVNQWTNVTYTYTGTTHSLYINGVLNNTSTTAQISGNFNQVFLNGYTGGGTNETGAYLIDTYYYYTRALSAVEVQTIYAAQGNRHGIVYGSLLRYEFDEGAVGAEITTVYNQTTHPGSVSNLVSNSARSPRVTYAASYAAHHLRPPLS